MHEITIDVDGVLYSVEYSIQEDGDEDLLVVHLPDGELATTVLRGGIGFKSAISTHVKAYALRQSKKA
ncbi:hypothetical protein [Delftia acidovorans]|uniref:hypothetical protein n=1 Tax=Delftia acidovorans TaxID=80866 RepID=UPI001C0B2458|nr:hypothetical protein [Delftia acidovorans]